MTSSDFEVKPSFFLLPKKKKMELYWLMKSPAVGNTPRAKGRI